MTFLIVLVLSLVVLGFVLNMAGLLTWVERKQSAVMQDRIGANRASIYGFRVLGLFHILADAIKMITKEDFVPRGADRFLHTLAPVIALGFALAASFAIPFGDYVVVGGRRIELQALPINVGLLFVFATVAMGVYGVIFGAWSSNNKFAILGGLRASAQVISYEIALGASLIGVLMIYGSLDLQEIVRGQGHHWWGWIPAWGVFAQPLAAVLFLTAATAETKRVPFDLPEAESEIIGYFTEYSGMKFGMFFMADFVETVVVSGMFTTLFLGGWQVPWLQADGWHFGGAFFAWPHWTVAALQVLAFVGKLCVMIWVLMTARWTFPRFRYDQLMRLGWRNLFPLAMANIFVTGLVLAALDAWRG